MKRIYISILTLCLISATSCKKYLDVNTNPNSPTSVTANLYLSPMLHWMVTSPQYDARFIGRYTQNWTLNSSNSTWDRMGYDPSSDNGGQLWRDVYWTFGQNLVDMTTKAEAEKRWDLLGVSYILKAWGWQSITDIHGEIIVKEAIDPTRYSFDYDSQDYAYQEIQRLLNLAITNLKRTDGAVDASFLGKTDLIYKGDRVKWLKFAYGLLAINLNHYSNKTSLYKPDDIIAAVDQSFTSNNDDALLQYTGISNDDRNFLGITRNNIGSYRQTNFAVNLMNGTVFGGVVDPRLSRILAPSPDGSYKGLEPTFGFGALTTAQRPNALWGYTGTQPIGTPSRYIFDDKSKVPAMTYSQLQFIKAEAAFRKGDKATALTAFRNGVSSHIDFVNARNLDNNQVPTQISATEKTTFMTSVAVPNTTAALTLSKIMSQKYIAQYGWGHLETWMDLRRYHYTDADPAGGQVFPGFTIPTNLYPDNAGNPVYRIRPRYNSEYVWNRIGLDAIGGLAPDYHTKQTWIIQP
ncbi:MAG: RagB/SusD family nutrient uptake outer membrane protein [Oligoflexus sp.]|nr:RagB/SusD family nutrient uptake outer membrane protein [Pseudopedobacter sp.]